MSSFKELAKIIRKNQPEADLDLARLAYDFAQNAHKGQKRFSGEPYFNHTLATAKILAENKADLPTIIAGLLHDIPEESTIPLVEIEKNFGKEISVLVQGVTKLGKIQYRGMDRYVENLKKMFLSAASDSRVFLIKFADRLHNLWTLESLPPQKRLRIAQETLKIYAPIAGLLGMWRLRWQLEDECFKYIDPENYDKIKKYYEIEQKYKREQYIEKIKQIVLTEAKKQKIKCEIGGRFKHIYSIFKKMQEKGKQFNEIYDVFALRIIVDTVSDCYKMLGIIHSFWRPKKDRFKDYIAVPKPNGYRSLHTTVFDSEGKLTEFQIRTREMNEEALYGIAAHWRYKESDRMEFKTKSEWINDILELQKQYKNADDYIKNFKFDILDDRIFVFTPKGGVIDLPKDATPIDFAYHVHTEIGNKCVGAIVNDKMAPLDNKLKSGDVVQIITEKNRPGPNLDWLKFAKTNLARSRIRHFAKSKGLLTALLTKIKKRTPRA